MIFAKIFCVWGYWVFPELTPLAELKWVKTEKKNWEAIWSSKMQNYIISPILRQEKGKKKD